MAIKPLREVITVSESSAQLDQAEGLVQDIMVTEDTSSSHAPQFFGRHDPTLGVRIRLVEFCILSLRRNRMSR